MKIDSFEPGQPSWVDLMTSDQDAAVEFYGKIFGWQTELSGPEMGNYGMAMKGDSPVAGIGPMPEGPPFPPSWSIYLSVADVDAVVASAAAAGGQVIAPVMDVAGEGQQAGRMAIIADPAGAVLGLWEPHEHHGSGIINEPGSFTWHELLSRDPQASVAFLSALFDYTWEQMDGAPMEYHIAKIAGREAVGVMAVPPDMPAEVPSHWNTYFAVEDTDETVAKAVAAGGSVQSPAFDSPFGRMAVLADPQGASFSIITDAQS